MTMVGRIRITLVSGLVYLLVAVGGCGNEYHPIIVGTYSSPSGDEEIVVSESKIRFKIRLNDSNGNRALDKTYDYTVESDGRLETVGVTSVDAAFGVGRFDWYWDGEKITQKDTRSNAPAKVFMLKQ